jgi:hypothetical protein
MMLPFITLQNVTFTGSAGYSAATNSNTGLVRIYVDAACKVVASTTSSAAITSLSGISMTASTFEYFAVPKGQSIYFSVVGVGV